MTYVTNYRGEAVSYEISGPVAPLFSYHNLSVYKITLKQVIKILEMH